MSSLGGRGQKLMGALNSAKIGDDAKLKKFQIFFSQKLVRSGKS
jgi:hypothetical protein